MTVPEFLRIDIVLFLHDHGVREFGGLQGMRDEGLLHGALARVENRLACGEPGPVDLHTFAAAYVFGIASNHPFNDGNKHAAWAACALFLKINGASVDAPAPEVIGRVVGLAAGWIDEAGFAAWLRSRSGVGA